MHSSLSRFQTDRGVWEVGTRRLPYYRLAGRPGGVLRLSRDHVVCARAQFHKPTTMSSESQLPQYTWEEISRHNSASSLWIVFDGKIYDVTAWKDEVGIRSSLSVCWPL